jgi:predicted component of type VI protein secretion system
MRLLYLVVSIRNLWTGETREEWFARSPVTVGRSKKNSLLLDERTVSSRHGSFLFGETSPLQYVDEGSTNGSYLDGVRLEPHKPAILRDRSVIGVPPFMMIVHMSREPPRDRATAADAETPVTDRQRAP